MNDGSGKKILEKESNNKTHLGYEKSAPEKTKEINNTAASFEYVKRRRQSEVGLHTH